MEKRSSPKRKSSDRNAIGPRNVVPTRRLRLPASGGGNPLHFVMQHQSQTQWCWAAVSVSICGFYQPTTGWTQCVLVNKALRQTTCCVNGGSSQCNQPWYLGTALRIVGNLRGSASGRATLVSVQSEINGGRPLCLRIGWNAGGGHFVAIYGYAGSNINIGDPWWGYTVQAYRDFPANYHSGGSWTDSYYTMS